MNSDSGTRTLEPEAETPLARLIEERGLRKGWIAQKLGISNSSLSRLIWGDRRMTLDEAVKLADLLSVEVRDLLPGDAA